MLPPEAVFELLGGQRGLEQVPELDERRAVLIETLRHKGGSDGSSLGNARRALERLTLYALEQGQSDGGLPASAVFVNRFLKWVDERALASARGSQGGTTVRQGVRTGLLFLAQHLKVAIDVQSVVAEAAAPPGKKRRRERRAGSIPIKLYCHFEEQAASAVASTARFYARSLLIGALFSSLRMVDALRAYVGDHDDPSVIMIVTAFSKDGEALDVYLPAEGFLGAWGWWPEHREALLGRPFLLPAFKATRGHAGDVRFATDVSERVTSKPHVERSFRALAALEPLGLDDAAWRALGLSPHSPHGSLADMGAVVSPDAPSEIAFSAQDENEICHWRRRARAQASDGELALDDSVAHLARRGQRGGAPRAAAPPATAAEDLSMRVRYTSGSNREGRRRAQLRVRRKLINAVRRGLHRFGKHWSELSGDRSDYDILEDLPPLES